MGWPAGVVGADGRRDMVDAGGMARPGSRRAPEWVAGVEDATTACMPVTCSAVALRRIRHVVPRIFRQSYLLTKLYKSSMIRSTENIEVDYLKVIDFQ